MLCTLGVGVTPARLCLGSPCAETCAVDRHGLSHHLRCLCYRTLCNPCRCQFGLSSEANGMQICIQTIRW
jgi:hypothetical protein